MDTTRKLHTNNAMSLHLYKYKHIIILFTTQSKTETEAQKIRPHGFWRGGDA